MYRLIQIDGLRIDGINLFRSIGEFLCLTRVKNIQADWRRFLKVS